MKIIKILSSITLCANIALPMPPIQPPNPMVYPAQIPNVNIGESVYMETQYILPTDIGAAQKNINAIIERVKKNKGFIQENSTVILQHHNGRSAFSLHQAVPVVKIKNKDGTFAYVVKDAHVKKLFANKILAQKAGISVPTMPIYVAEDASMQPAT